MAPIRIGVLALQGSFREHMTLLNHIPGVEAVEIRTAEQLRSVSGLIIPGMLILQSQYSPGILLYSLRVSLYSRANTNNHVFIQVEKAPRWPW